MTTKLDRPVIWLASEDWTAEAAQASYHITRELSHRIQILYCNSIGIRKPQLLNSNDFRKAISKIARFAKGAKRVSDTLSVLTPFGFPVSMGSWTARVNPAIVLTQLRISAQRMGFALSDALFWVSFPGWASAVRKLQIPPNQIILHFFDRWEEYGGVNPARILKLREELIACSGLILASSEELVGELSNLHSRVYLAPHGLCLDIFAGASRKSTPSDLREIPHPIVGFFGTIDSFWIDFDLLYACAKLDASYSWVFIGRVGYLDTHDNEVVINLKSLPNVHFLGAKQHEDIPAYGKSFDVGVLPFKESGLTKSASPLKLPEYLALGLPVVSTVMQQYGSLSAYVNVVQGRTVDGLMKEIAISLQQGQDDRRRRKDLLKEYDWPNTVDKYLTLAEKSGMSLS